MLHLARGDIAQLVELRSCNWVVAITGWMSNCPGSNDSILYLNRWLTFFLSNGEEDRNMPLKDSTETKQRWAVKNVEEVGWAVGQIQYGSYMDGSWSRRLS